MRVSGTAGLQCSDLYITNAVKHFRFLYRDSFRQHQLPSGYHVRACRPWLEREIATIRPKLVLCLGNTAARSLIHPNFTLKNSRATPIGEHPVMFATYHPSAILRTPNAQRQKMQQDFISDLRAAATLVEQ